MPTENDRPAREAVLGAAGMMEALINGSAIGPQRGRVPEGGVVTVTGVGAEDGTVAMLVLIQPEGALATHLARIRREQARRQKQAQRARESAGETAASLKMRIVTPSAPR